jgi:Chromo (CHRromatin Organisation MOdifier) domain
MYVSIAHLEPAKDDPFQRPTPTHPEAVNADEWEIERIINKGVRKVRGKEVIEYLVRWTGYNGPEYDQWYKEKDLPNAKELILEYEESQAPRKESKKGRIKSLFSSLL